MMILVKLVIIIKIAGANVNTVKIITSLTAFTISLGFSAVLKPKLMLGKVTCEKACEHTVSKAKKKIKNKLLFFTKWTSCF
jgi:hypothetical protein